MNGDLTDLYQEVILDHSKSPRNFGAAEEATHTARGNNPLCGDRVAVYLTLEDDIISDAHFDGRGCAISVASGSILHDLVEGVSLDEAHALIAAVKAVMHGGDMPTDIELGDFDSLEGVKLFPVRIKCALLPWTTLDEALVDADKLIAARASEGETS